jgi:WD40 repeat protein
MMAHQLPMLKGSGYQAQIQSRNQASVTALSFLDEARPHLLLSGSEANATVKVWDLRSKSSGRKWQPIGATRQPEAHGQHRKFGLTSMVLSGDCSRLYTLCKDHTMYAYSVNHLLLGTAPEMESGTGTWKRRSETKEGLGPLYGMRHPKLKVPTFYIKSALRPCRFGNAEVLAVGSTESCAVLFPLDEDFVHSRRNQENFGTPIKRPALRNPKLPNEADSRLEVTQKGTALVRGHNREVTGLSWTPKGELVTIGDDYQCRVWREDAEHARELRTCGESGGKRWSQGWANIQAEDASWDEDE